MPTFTGGQGDDAIVGTGENDILVGSGGNDLLIGGSGDDDLRGGDGNDILIGGLASFVNFSATFGTAFVTVFPDALTNGGTDLLDGGSGIDWAVLTYTQTSGAIIFDNSQIDAVNRITVGGVNAGSVTSVERLTFFSGSGNDRITGGAAHDIIYGGAGHDILSGGGGVDHLIGGLGDDILNGGAGQDMAVYSGPRRLYQVGPNQVSGYGEGADTLSSIEIIRFVDGSMSYGSDTAAAQAMRLHIAALGRQPESQARFSGLADLHQARGFFGAGDIAELYFASAELQSRYGGLSNRAFVETLYRLCMNREGEPAGVANWTGLLDAGRSRSQVLFEFSDSLEFRAITADIIQGGLWVENQAALSVARLFDAAFDTLPDAAGLIQYTSTLQPNTFSGQTIQSGLFDVAASLVASAAFQSSYGGLSNREFVEQLYRMVLDRPGEPSGLNYWTDQLDRGQLRSQVLVHFSESPEHVALTRSLWEGGVRTSDGSAQWASESLLPGEAISGSLPADEPADSSFWMLDYEADAIVFGALEEMNLPTVDPADLLNGLDIAAAHTTALNDSRVVLALPAAIDGAPEFDLDAWSPGQREGHWLI